MKFKDLGMANTSFLLRYIITLLWPFFGLIHTLINFRSVHTKNIIWIFSAFYGLTMIMPEANMDHDLIRYERAFQNMVDQRHLPFWDIFSEPFNQGIYSAADVYLILLNLVVSRITGDFRIFLMTVAIVFGYFYSRNITLIFDHYRPSHVRSYAILLIASIMLLYPFWSIGGYRFVTAAMIFSYGLLHFKVLNKKRYLIFILISPLVHFTMALGVVAFIIYSIIGDRLWLYIILLLVSFAFLRVNPENLNSQAELAPIFLQGKIKGYTSQDYLKMVTNNTSIENWYVRGHFISLQGSVLILLALFLIKSEYYLTEILSKTLLCFGLFLYAISNFITSVPGGSRFTVMAIFIILISFLSIIVSEKKIPRFVRYLTIPLFLFFFIVKIRMGFDDTGLNTIFLNPFVALFFPDSPALIDFIK